MANVKLMSFALSLLAARGLLFSLEGTSAFSFVCLKTFAVCVAFE